MSPQAFLDPLCPNGDNAATAATMCWQLIKDDVPVPPGLVALGLGRSPTSNRIKRQSCRRPLIAPVVAEEMQQQTRDKEELFSCTAKLVLLLRILLLLLLR